MAFQYGRTGELTATNIETGESKTFRCGTQEDGSEGLRLGFKIVKIDSSLDTATIKLFNLMPTTMEFLSSTDIYMELTIGYIENKSLAFTGKVLQAVNERNGLDAIITIDCVSGLELTIKSRTNKKIKKGSKIEDILSDLMDDIEEGEKGFVDKIESTKTTIRSRTLSEGTIDILRKYGIDYDFFVNIENDKVNIYGKNYDPDASKSVILNSKTGLVDIPKATEIGVEFKALINPKVAPFTYIVLESKSDFMGGTKAFKDGVYGVLSVTFEGDTGGTDWFMTGSTKYKGEVMEWE